MSKRIYGVISLVLFFLIAATIPAQGQSSHAKALLAEAAKAMGGINALRALKNQVVESEGKQFEHASPRRPLGPGQQISTFRYTLTRDLTQPRLRLEFQGTVITRNNLPVRWIEVIDGSVGLLQEGAPGTESKQIRLHPWRLETRLRDEKRSAAKIIFTAMGQKNLKRLSDADLEGKSYRVLAFTDTGNEFRLYLDSKTKLPARVDLLDDDPLEGDSLFTLRYDDWRKVDGVMAPFTLRYELNGKPLQEEQIKSLRHNVTLAPDSFAIPAAIRDQKVDAQPVASQWLLRRIAGNFSYRDLGRNTPVEFVQLGDGVHLITGSSHNNVVIEMRDHLVVVEGPLYEARSQAVIKSLKARFPGKPIRYIIPTHAHLDHSGGIRGFMAEGAMVVVPAIAKEFYTRVARAPHMVEPDALEKVGRAVTIEYYDGGYRVLSDGNRHVEIHPMPTSHADDNQVVYLPREKIVVEADHVSPRNNKVIPSARVREFLQGIEMLNLDVTTIVGIHGNTADIQALRTAAKGGK